jgi:hypothetical protein
MKQSGQIAIILLLFMLVALTIGLAATQRSITNITTSSQTEQSSRAFSAAEAGLQKSMSAINPIVLTGPNPSPPPINESELGNSSNANIRVVNNLPRIGEALEYPPIGRDEIAQFWLANPTNIVSGSSVVWVKGIGNFSDPQFVFSGASVNVYFGNGNPVSAPHPAIEVNLIVQSFSGGYASQRFFFDPDIARTASNNFTPLPVGSCGILPIHTSSSVDSVVADRSFYCVASVPIDPGDAPILIRARILYSVAKEPIAVEPTGGCGINCSLPPQAAIYTAKGFSGQSQKTLQVFRQPFYLSPLLDFALFSAAQITK